LRRLPKGFHRPEETSCTVSNPARRPTSSAEEQPADLGIGEQHLPAPGERQLARGEHVADVSELEAFLGVLLDHHDRLAFLALQVARISNTIAMKRGSRPIEGSSTNNTSGS
jgi:hypothetical protein